MNLRHHSFTSFVALLLIMTAGYSQTATAPSAGDGTSGDPYQIATLDNLYWITQNTSEWDVYFVQSANIDASSTSGWDSGSGFSPIGNGSTSFTGSYDGGGYTISGLTIARSSTDNIGLFGFISDGTVKNITLTGIAISGASYVGGVVGFSTGSGSSLIDNCSSAGTVSGTTAYVGGLVGATAAATTITECFSTADVSSTSGNYVGGFIGRHTQGSSISYSYSRGNVSSADGDFVGGFAGGVVFVSPSSPTVSNCYATGNAYSYNRAGGFVGVLQSATLTNCYSKGSATLNGGSTSGGFVALNSSGTVNNSFWDTEASGNGSSAAGTGKTTSEMKTSSTFTDAGWDFSGTWEIVGSNYPRLQSIPDGALPVQMTGLVAEVGEGTVRLQWSTVTEVDNSGWEVERSSRQSTVDSRQTKAGGWEKIGFVEGGGTSTSQRTYSFSDPNTFSILHFPFSISYRLKQIDRSGSFSYSETIEVDLTSAPRVLFLSQNFPNPFNPSTTIDFTLSEDGQVTLVLFDLLGRQVQTLFSGRVSAGVSQRVVIDASQLSSGVYVYRLIGAGQHLTRRMLLTK